MRVFITGGTGAVGKAAVKRLVDNRYSVKVAGRRPDLQIPGGEYVQCDINDYERLVAEMEGCDAVVHLAAIPSPAGGPGRELFRVNDLGSFNVFEAAAYHGIRRVVGASSINALGYFYGNRGFPIRYLPVDEAHPAMATDAYSFSKQVMEDIGRYFWDREGISSVMLRLPGVWSHARLQEAQGGADDFRASQRSLIEETLALPEAERKRRVAQLHEDYDRFRATKAMEMPRAAVEQQRFMGKTELGLMISKVNFWAYVDELDSAEAIEKGLTARYEGSHPLFVNSNRNVLNIPVSELAQLFYPEVSEIRSSRAGDSCLVSIDRARELLGFEPHHAVIGAKRLSDPKDEMAGKGAAEEGVQ